MPANVEDNIALPFREEAILKLLDSPRLPLRDKNDSKWPVHLDARQFGGWIKFTTLIGERYCYGKHVGALFFSTDPAIDLLDADKT